MTFYPTTINFPSRPSAGGSVLSTRYRILAIVIISLCFSSPSKAQRSNEFLGIRLSTPVQQVVDEIEQRSGKRLQASFQELGRFELGTSFIDDDTGTATLYVDESLEGEAKKLEAVIAHELLHLRLRVNNFPAFIFSPDVKTAKGRAIDVEQGHINDLISLIEHRVFKADMERFGVYKYIDLAGDTAADARQRRGDEDGQADSINYARAILEYPNPSDVTKVRQLFQANGWTRSLKEGASMADIITTADPRTPSAVQAVFLKCLLVLFPVPRSNVAFYLTPDPTNKYFRRMVINLGRLDRKRNRKRI